ncbi:MAG: sulfatase-like hydrolase/transferase [Rikenellaceae bacterium]
MNKSIILSGALVSSICLSAEFAEAKSNVAKKPDILFIFVDDMTYDGLGALGNSDIKSPNLDKLVNSGVTLANNYNMGGWNGAISQASRTQLITGMTIWNAYEQQESNKFKTLVDSRTLWPQVMKDAGYKTYHTGKWHMSHVSPRNIFDEVEGGSGGMMKDHYDFKTPTYGVPNTYLGYERPLSRDDNSWLPWDTSHGGYWKENGKHWSEIQADYIIGYMQRNKDSEEPLFMSVAFNAPHDPRQSPKEYVDMYDVNKITIPKSFQGEHPYMEEMACGKTLRDEELAPWPRTEYAVQKHRQEYYALITHLDDQIGRILEELKRTGRAENTLIVFSADNGLALGKHGLLGKQSMYEHSLRVPLVFSGLGLPQGQTRTQLTYMQDLVPTVMEIAGIKRPENMDFISELNIVKDGSLVSNRKGIYGAYLDVQRMVRNERYKLFLIPKAKKAYLFDLKQDPEEMNNLYGDPKYDAVVKELAEKYIVLGKEAGERYDITGAFPEIFGSKR